MPTGSSAHFCKIGTANATVLPDPVLLPPITSSPSSIFGMHPFWMPVGLVMAIDESDATSHGLTSSAANVMYAAGLLLPGRLEGATISFCCFEIDEPGFEILGPRDMGQGVNVCIFKASRSHSTGKKLSLQLDFGSFTILDMIMRKTPVIPMKVKWGQTFPVGSSSGYGFANLGTNDLKKIQRQLFSASLYQISLKVHTPYPIDYWSTERSAQWIVALLLQIPLCQT